MNIELKIKSCSLAEEAKIIRRHERRLLRSLRRKPDWPNTGSSNQIEAFNRLRGHRTDIVRKEARCTHLAYGFLRGRRYRQIEEKAYSKPDWKVVERLIQRYGVGDQRELMQRFEEWKQEPLDSRFDDLRYV